MRNDEGFGTSTWSRTNSAREERLYAKKRAKVARLAAANSTSTEDAKLLLSILGLTADEGVSDLAREPLWGQCRPAGSGKWGSERGLGDPRPRVAACSPA